MGAVDYDAIAASYDRRYEVNDSSRVRAAFVADVANGRALEAGFRRSVREADARGETLWLTADLRLYGTHATAPR